LFLQSNVISSGGGTRGGTSQDNGCDTNSRYGGDGTDGDTGDLAGTQILVVPDDHDGAVVIGADGVEVGATS
jgi:hypothetical protein